MSYITRKITRNQLKELYEQQYKELCEKDKEIERLNKELQDTKEHLGEYLHEQEEENKRLNNIINELENYAKELKWYDNESVYFEIGNTILDKIKELRGDSK